MYIPNIFFAEASRRFRLEDRSYCRIRRSSGRDRQMLTECFGRLSADSRRRRFFAAKPALSAKDLDFLTGADVFAASSVKYWPITTGCVPSPRERVVEPTGTVMARWSMTGRCPRRRPWRVRYGLGILVRIIPTRLISG